MKKGTKVIYNNQEYEDMLLISKITLKKVMVVVIKVISDAI